MFATTTVICLDPRPSRGEYTDDAANKKGFTEGGSSSFRKTRFKRKGYTHTNLPAQTGRQM